MRKTHKLAMLASATIAAGLAVAPAPVSATLAPEDSLCEYTAFRVRALVVPCGQEDTMLRELQANIPMHDEDPNYDRVRSSISVLKQLKDKPAGTYRFGKTKSVYRIDHQVGSLGATKGTSRSWSELTDAEKQEVINESRGVSVEEVHATIQEYNMHYGEMVEFFSEVNNIGQRTNYGVHECSGSVANCGNDSSNGNEDNGDGVGGGNSVSDPRDSPQDDRSNAANDLGDGPGGNGVGGNAGRGDQPAG